MWLPKSKYTVKYARLGEMKRPDGTPYVGPYMEAYNGKCYLGKEFNKNTVELVVESPQAQVCQFCREGRGGGIALNITTGGLPE